MFFETPISRARVATLPMLELRIVLYSFSENTVEAVRGVF